MSSTLLDEIAMQPHVLMLIWRERRDEMYPTFVKQYHNMTQTYVKIKINTTNPHENSSLAICSTRHCL